MDTYGTRPEDSYAPSPEDIYGAPAGVYGTHHENIYDGTGMHICGLHPEDLYGRTQQVIYGHDPSFMYGTNPHVNEALTGNNVGITSGTPGEVTAETLYGVLG